MAAYFTSGSTRCWKWLFSTVLIFEKRKWRLLRRSLADLRSSYFCVLSMLSAKICSLYCSIEYFKRKSYRLSKFPFFAIICKLSVLSIRFAIRTYHAEPISLYHLTEKGLARIIWYSIKVCMQYFWLYRVSKLGNIFSFDELDWIADTSIHRCLVLHASDNDCAKLCNEFSCCLVYLGLTAWPSCCLWFSCIDVNPELKIRPWN